jgi:hypothetical protein
MEFYNSGLIEKYGAFAIEKQSFFADIVQEMDWNADIEKGQIIFGGNLIFPIQILGTFSHSSETWLWSWANSRSGIPEKLLEHAKKLKKYGNVNKIDFFTESEFEIERDGMHYIGMVALGITEADGYYLGNYGAGTICLTVNAENAGKKFPNNHISIFSTFPQLMSQFAINHKEAFVHYLNAKQYAVETNENEIIGIRDKNKVKAVFDNLGRLTNLKDIK